MSAVDGRPDGLLAKWMLIGAAHRDPKLSSADHAVLWQILERYNSEKGAAWPSLKRLASDTGRGQRTVQNSTKRLEKHGYVAIISGNRTISNRYKPNFKVGAQTSECMAAEFPDVGKPTAMESSEQPGQQAAVERGLAIPASDVSAPLPSVVAIPAEPDVPYRKHKWFWDAYPMSYGRQTVTVESQIELLLSKGVLQEDILAGATAYAAQLRAKPWQDLKYTKRPLNWLEDSGWLDDYPLPTPKPEKRRAKEAPSVAVGKKKKKKGHKKVANHAAELSGSLTKKPVLEVPEKRSFRIGDFVCHSKFGKGPIINIEGGVAEVLFDNWINKKVNMDFLVLID